MWYIVLSRSKPEMEQDKQSHYDEHRLCWRNSTKPDGSCSPDPPPMARMESISCWPPPSMRRRRSPPRTHITAAVSAPWKCSNGTRAAPFGWTSSPSPTSNGWRVTDDDSLLPILSPRFTTPRATAVFAIVTVGSLSAHGELEICPPMMSLPNHRISAARDLPVLLTPRATLV